MAKRPKPPVFLKDPPEDTPRLDIGLDDDDIALLEEIQDEAAEKFDLGADDDGQDDDGHPTE